MRSRPSSRLLVVDSDGRVLLFRFAFTDGVLAGQSYWATPGGAVDDGESFEQAAIRELREETGIRVDDVSPQVARREFVLQVPTGEQVMADERFFLVRADGTAISRDGWTALEREVMAEFKWWSHDDLARTTETVWPENLSDMLRIAAGETST